MRRQLLAAVLVALVFVPVGRAWTWPATGAVLQPFLFDPAHPYAAGQHRGIDVGGDIGATVLAPATGTVTFAGIVPSSGNTMTIATVDGYAVTLTHLGSITAPGSGARNAGGSAGCAGGGGRSGARSPTRSGDRRTNGYRARPGGRRETDARSSSHIRSCVCDRRAGREPRRAGDVVRRSGERG